MGKPLLNGDSTEPEWAAARPEICVLPVGAFEQHSHHLPLQSDVLQATWFGELLARELGAALLPTLPFGTSFEHSGFCGTFSLRPETLAAVVRDLAEEAEQQGFRVMILVNSHGGNFILTPTVRDYNRRDRPLKIILSNPWDDAYELFPQAEAPDLHAGAVETSFMLHLFPALVRGERCDATDERWLKQTFSRPDLNLYGVKAVAPEGALGKPSRASAGTGEGIVAVIKERTVPQLRRRLEWLEKTRRYAGGKS